VNRRYFFKLATLTAALAPFLRPFKSKASPIKPLPWKCEFIDLPPKFDESILESGPPPNFSITPVGEYPFREYRLEVSRDIYGYSPAIQIISEQLSTRYTLTTAKLFEAFHPTIIDSLEFMEAIFIDRLSLDREFFGPYLKVKSVWRVTTKLKPI
jgi:hypothetical protein